MAREQCCYRPGFNEGGEFSRGMEVKFITSA